MKEKSFAPLLAPNQEINLEELNYSLLISYKLDGCRLLIRNGQLLTRSLKFLPNEQLRAKFYPLARFSENNNIFMDGEVFSPNIPFQFIVSCFMTEDYTAKLAIKKWAELCQEHDYFISRQEVFDKLKFYMFDGIKQDQFDEPFGMRYINNVNKWSKLFPDLIEEVKHVVVNNPEEVQSYFEEALEKGMEGLILRNPDSSYKFGRATIRENNIYKLKPWKSIDSKIIGFVQATKVNEDAEKTTTELGYSRTSKKAEDRHLIEKAQAFIVDYEGKELSVPLAMTDEQKEYIWKHKEEYLGKYVEYKFMNIGMKKDGLPRIPKMVRMRLDKS
jgi:DNA ligase-1